MTKRVIVGLVLASMSGVATAQPTPSGDPGAPPPPPAVGATVGAEVGVAPAPVAAAPVDEHAGVDKGVLEDANAGRSWVAPTALAEPKGTFTFSDFELFLISASYAITDELSVSATTIIPITTDVPKVGFFSAKMQVLKAGRIRVAGQAALMAGLITDTSTVNGMDTSSSASAFFLNVGGAATYCLDEDCHSTVSGYLGAGFARNSGNAVPFLVSGNGAFRLNKHVKLIAEVDSGFVAGDVNATAGGFLLWYGARFTSAMIGVDLGFVKPFTTSFESTGDVLPLGFPMLSFSYRAI